jgi:hypothetical protein
MVENELRFSCEGFIKVKIFLEALVLRKICNEKCILVVFRISFFPLLYIFVLLPVISFDILNWGEKSTGPTH